MISLKHELAELCLVKVPPSLASVGVTVMDGPFFSLMPFPAEKCHTLSHVRFTPHISWTQDEETPAEARSEEGRRSAFSLMQRDSQRFVPALNELQFLRSLFAVKTVLPQTETSDGRPILYARDHALKGLNVILGGKIDNVYDVLDMIDQLD